MFPRSYPPHVPPGEIPVRSLRIAVLLAVAAGLALFVLPVKDGRPLLSPSELKGRAAGLAAEPGGSTSPGGERTLYRWRGEDGTWHYSNVRPADHPEAEEVRTGVSWVEGGEGAGGEEETRAKPGSAGELLERSRDLDRQVQGRDAQLRELMGEATP